MVKQLKWKIAIARTFWIFILIYVSSCEKCPEYCHCSFVSRLRHAKCASQLLVNIDLDLPKRVQSLDLSNNSISFLDDRGFQMNGLTNLVNIDMKYNSIIHIGRDAFYGLYKLHYINLKGNHLHNIHPDIFHGNSNLMDVILADNPLQQMRNEPLLKGHSIQSLDISGCRFGYFMKKTFENFESLKFLNVSQNNLILIDFSAIETLVKRNIKEIDISGNQINCDESFQSLLSALQDKPVTIIGGPCAFSPPPLSGQVNLFEKLIVANNNATEFIDLDTNESISHELFENKFTETMINSHKNDVKIQEYNFLQNKTHTNIKFLSGYNNIVNIPQVWVFAIGFQMGVITTLALIFIIWCTCNINKILYKKVEPLQANLI